SGVHNPREFITAEHNGTATAADSLAGRNIELYSVAYGLPGFSDVNPDLMADLAAGSALNGGSPHVSNVDKDGITAMTLATSLRDAMKSGMVGTTSPLDPAGVFPIGTSEIRHDVVISDFDSKAAFGLTWNRPD